MKFSIKDFFSKCNQMCSVRFCFLFNVDKMVETRKKLYSINKRVLKDSHKNAR